MLLCSNIRASNFEIKCKLERTFFSLSSVDTSYLCRDDLNQRFLYCRRNSFWQTNYTQINSLAGLRESVTVSARSCWIYECPLQFFAQKPAAKYQNVLLLGLPTSLHTTIQTAGTSKMKGFCCYVGKMIKTHGIMTELTHGHTRQTARGSFFRDSEIQGCRVWRESLLIACIWKCSAGTRR